MLLEGNTSRSTHATPPWSRGGWTGGEGMRECVTHGEGGRGRGSEKADFGQRGGGGVGGAQMSRDSAGRVRKESRHEHCTQGAPVGE